MLDHLAASQMPAWLPVPRDHYGSGFEGSATLSDLEESGHTVLDDSSTLHDRIASDDRRVALIPFFFVGTGMAPDVRSLVEEPSTLLRVPLFLAHPARRACHAGDVVPPDAD